MVKYGTKRTGVSFSAAEKLAVWSKGRNAPGRSPSEWRLDVCGALMQYSKYGDTTKGGTGWEIDHIYPSAHGGGDELSNLQPLQWENNRAKGDAIGNWRCAVSQTH
jgi:hypothetical protein